MMQDDGTFGEDGEGSPLAASPGSVSLGEDSSDEDDEEDGDAAEHRVNVRTGQLDGLNVTCHHFLSVFVC